MLDVCLLGTGGTMPMPERALTSLFLRCNGKCILTDCGEGTQLMIRKSGFSLNKIDAIFITHFHADHISGLPGLLLSIGKSERTAPVMIYGGKGLTDVVNSICVIARELPFEVICTELENVCEQIQLGDFYIEARMLEHSVPCFGYSFSIKRKRRFDRDKAVSLNIPQMLWSKLHKGNEVEYNGKIIKPQDVLSDERKGVKVAYCTDTRPCSNIVYLAKDSDLFICEGMYAESSKLAKAYLNKHMMFEEAAYAARSANAKEMWLTHFSPSLKEPEVFIDCASKIFENTVIPNDLQKCILMFEHE